MEERVIYGVTFLKSRRVGAQPACGAERVGSDGAGWWWTGYVARSRGSGTSRWGAGGGGTWPGGGGSGDGVGDVVADRPRLDRHAKKKRRPRE